MSLVVNTNVGSLNAQRSLAASGAELKTAMERLSSGSKINSASDDAAGFAIAERMTAQIRGLNMAAKNAGDGLSMLSAIENATNDVTDMLQRMRELAVQAVNDTNTQQDREYLQGEVSALVAEIDRVATQTQYNGQAILDGSMSGNIQVGTEAGQSVEFGISSISSVALGLSGPEEITVTVSGYQDEIETQSPNAFSGIINLTTEQGSYEINMANYQGGTHVENLQTALMDTLGPEAVVFNLNDVWENSNYEDGDWTVTALDISHGQFEIQDTVTGNNSYNFHGGYGPDNTNDADSPSGYRTMTKTISSSEFGTANGINLVENASQALATITAAIEQVAGDRAEYGALQNRLEYTVSNLMNVSEFTTAARSRIADADFAAESARLAKAQVLQQSGTAMLAQANASSQLALSLIQ